MRADSMLTAGLSRPPDASALMRDRFSPRSETKSSMCRVTARASCSLLDPAAELRLRDDSRVSRMATAPTTGTETTRSPATSRNASRPRHLRNSDVMPDRRSIAALGRVRRRLEVGGEVGEQGGGGGDLLGG